MNRPNILFINTDQHTWDALSFFGNSDLHTPHIDSICEHGVVFSRSYCSDPVCCPARASWVTGRYPSETGVPINGGTLRDDLPDLGELLRAAGYDTYHAGKWHVTGREVERGFTDLYSGRRRIGASGGEYFDAATTHAAAAFLAGRTSERPFYLELGYVDPHDICEHLHSFEHRNPPDLVAAGVTYETDLPTLPPNFRFDERETTLQKTFRRVREPIMFSPLAAKMESWSSLDWRSLLWSYYRYVERVDAQIGTLVGLLRSSRFCDNTIVIFSADHGESAGRHRMFQKFTLYEESIRVPFVVATFEGNGSPGTLPLDPGRIDDSHLVGGVDLVPTICDFAGAEVPREASGQSVRKLLTDVGSNWRESLTVQSNFWGRAIIGERYKLITEYIPTHDRVSGGTGANLPPSPDTHQFGAAQLFDLHDDPWETRNLADEPAVGPVLQELLLQLAAHDRLLEPYPISDERTLGLLDGYAGRLHAEWERAGSATD